MKFIFLLSLIISLNANSLEVVRKDNQLILKDSSCDSIIEVSKSIIEWVKNTKEVNICPDHLDAKKPFFLSSNCEMDITNCVPAHVAKYQGVKPEYAGPNCWNLALVMKGILPNLRYTSPDEMAFYMRPPICRQIKNDEKKMPGDVGAIRSINDKTSDEYHGFIYISDKVAYSKNGYMNSNPYSLQTLENVYDVYGVSRKKECRENELNYSANCGIGVSYFRCISMDEYLKDNSNGPAQIIKTLKTVKNFESCLELKAIKGNEFSPGAVSVITDTEKALTFYLSEEMKSQKKLPPAEEETRNFLLGSLQLRLGAIAEQLHSSRDYDLESEVGKFANSIKKSLEEIKGKTL